MAKMAFTPKRIIGTDENGRHLIAVLRDQESEMLTLLLPAIFTPENPMQVITVDKAMMQANRENDTKSAEKLEADLDDIRTILSRTQLGSYRRSLELIASKFGMKIDG